MDWGLMESGSCSSVRFIEASNMYSQPATNLEMQSMLEYALVMWIAVTGVPMAILDNPFTRNLFSKTQEDQNAKRSTSTVSGRSKRLNNARKENTTALQEYFQFPSHLSKHNKNGIPSPRDF
jgi:hypothetical protein